MGNVRQAMKFSSHSSAFWNCLSHLPTYKAFSVSLIRAREHKVKGIITTTSDFPPNIMKDPFIAPFVPYRLELMNGKALQEWLKKLAERT